MLWAVLKLKVVWFFCSHPVFFLEIDPRLLTPDQPIFGHSAKVVLQHGQEEKWCCKIHTDQKLLFGCNLGWKPTLTFGFFLKAKAVEKANQQWRSYVDVPGSADPDGFGVALVAGNFLPVKTPVKKIRDPGRLAAHSL